MKKDALVIGGGVNGFVAACYLAKSGKSVALIAPEHQRDGFCEMLMTTAMRMIAHDAASCTLFFSC